MTSEPVEGVAFKLHLLKRSFLEGKTILSYICLPFRSPTQASQFTGTSSFYRSLWLHPLMTQLTQNNILVTNLGFKVNRPFEWTLVHKSISSKTQWLLFWQCLKTKTYLYFQSQKSPRNLLTLIRWVEAVRLSPNESKF